MTFWDAKIEGCSFLWGNEVGYTSHHFKHKLWRGLHWRGKNSPLLTCPLICLHTSGTKSKKVLSWSASALWKSFCDRCFTSCQEKRWHRGNLETTWLSHVKRGAWTWISFFNGVPFYVVNNNNLSITSKCTFIPYLSKHVMQPSMKCLPRPTASTHKQCRFLLTEQETKISLGLSEWIGHR